MDKSGLNKGTECKLFSQLRLLKSLDCDATELDSSSHFFYLVLFSIKAMHYCRKISQDSFRFCFSLIYLQNALIFFCCPHHHKNPFPPARSCSLFDSSKNSLKCLQFWPKFDILWSLKLSGKGCLHCQCHLSLLSCDENVWFTKHIFFKLWQFI